MIHKRVLLATPGTKQGQHRMGMEAQRVFPGHWDTVLQITIPTAIEARDLETNKALVKLVVDDAIFEALEQWPWPWEPRWAYIDFEPEGWIYDGSIKDGFDKYDERMIEWMIQHARSRLGNKCKIGLYGVPHIPRGVVQPTDSVKKIMGDSWAVMTSCDYITANHYIGPGQRQPPLGMTEPEWAEWAMAHIHKVDYSLDIVQSIADGRPSIPMLWTGWLSNPESYFATHLDAYEKHGGVDTIMLWFNVNGKETQDIQGNPKPSLKTTLSIDRFREVEQQLKRWIDS